MALISNLVARLTAETSSFEKGMSRSRHSLSRFSREVLSLAGIGGGMYGLKRATEVCMRAAMDQEKAEIELAAALGETDLVTRKSVEIYKAFASQMQRQTIYADELILSQMAYAKNLGVTEDSLKDATKAAIGLAAAYRIELESAMMLVGRASQGQTQMLARYGIVIDESLSAQEKFNKLLDIGAGKFHLAEAETKTISGQMAQFKNSVNEAAEEVGGPLSRALGEFLRILREIGKEIKEGPFRKDWLEELEKRERIPEIIPLPEPWRRMVEPVEPTLPTIPQIPTTPAPWREKVPQLRLEIETQKAIQFQQEFERQLREGTGPAIEYVTDESQKYANLFEWQMEAAEEAWKKHQEDLDEIAAKWKQVGTVMEYSLTSAFDKMIWEAQSWKEAMLDVLRAVVREMMRVWMIQPLASAFTGGVEKAIFTRAIAPHRGGMVGDTFMPTRMLPAWAFAGAPRLHAGLAADEFPAILQAGERVIPRGGASTTVNIINQSGVPLSAQASSRFDAGQMVVDIVVDNAVRHGRVYDIIRTIAKQT